MKKKTPHRLLHDSLTPEQYAKFMRNFDREYALTYDYFKAYYAFEALSSAFGWEDSKEKNDYWRDIHINLVECGI